MTKACVLVIGGLDPQGCAGISADIQSVTNNGGYAVPLVTCLTEQNSQGLIALGALSKDQFWGQYESAVADFDISAIKIGLIPNIEIARCISEIIDKHAAPVVLDPVLASTSGGVAADDSLIGFIQATLIPKTTLVTPNLIELSQLTQSDVTDYDAIESVAKAVHHENTAVLVKGGHSNTEWAADYFFDGENHFYCYHKKLPISVRGTGCVLASSVASHLALGMDVRDAIVLAKAYLNRGIRLSAELGPYHVIYHSQDKMILDDMPKLCYQSELIGIQFNFPSSPKRLGIYPVVDNSDWVVKLIDEGITTIQLRVKEQTEAVTKQQIANAVSASTDEIAFFVNDYWQMAIDVGAYGVHLGQEDLHDASLEKIQQAGLRLGISTHSYWELARALAVNPSYIALGPVYETTSKQMPWIPQGEERVAQWVELLDGAYPLVAIGGIDLERAKKLKPTKVGSVAMISAITKAADYKKATQDLIACWAG